MAEAQQEQDQAQREQAQREQAQREQRQRDQQQRESRERETQEQTEKAQQEREQALQQERDEAERKLQRPQMIGMERRQYVPPPNAPGAAVKAGPMTMQFAIGEAPIFQRYGKRYQVVGTAAGGVLAVDLEAAEPKTVYHMGQPSETEEAPKE